MSAMPALSACNCERGGGVWCKIRTTAVRALWSRRALMSQARQVSASRSCERGEGEAKRG
eukprot:2634603-Pleurochrysis_carterae.AAC.1